MSSIGSDTGSFAAAGPAFKSSDGDESPTKMTSNPITAEEIRNSRKSAVRVLVTYIAAGFLFAGGAGFVAALLILGQVEDAKNVFLAILPVSAAVITFWFAGRNNQQLDIVEIIKASKVPDSSPATPDSGRTPLSNPSS